MVVGTQLGYFALAAPALVLSALALVRYFAAPHVPLDGQLDALVSYAGALSVLVLVPADVWSALNRPDRAAVPDSGDRKVRWGARLGAGRACALVPPCCWLVRSLIGGASRRMR